MTSAAQRRREREIPPAWRFHTRPSTQDMSDMTTTGQVSADPGRRQDWTSQAVCRDVDPDLFFSPFNGTLGRQWDDAAKAICRTRCPVRAECLRWARDALPFGVAGGHTADERAALRRSGRARGAA